MENLKSRVIMLPHEKRATEEETLLLGAITEVTPELVTRRSPDVFKNIFK